MWKPIASPGTRNVGILKERVRRIEDGDLGLSWIVLISASILISQVS